MADDGDEATLVINRQEEFGSTYAHIKAWRIPTSERYPEGVKYSMQYGTKNTDEMEAAETEDGTIIRYDNFPDHPETDHHHKHLADGSVVAVDYPSLRSLFEQFKQEVREHGEHWE